MAGIDFEVLAWLKEYEGFDVVTPVIFLLKETVKLS